MGACLHQVNGGLLTNLSRENDEGQVETALLHDPQCVKTAEGGHDVI
jgi:hypothetical protein